MEKPKHRRTVEGHQTTTRTRGRMEKERQRQGTKEAQATCLQRIQEEARIQIKKEQDNEKPAGTKTGQLMTQAAGILTGDNGNGKKGKRKQAKSKEGEQPPDKTKKAKKDPVQDSPLKQTNRHNKQERAKDEACRKAVKSTGNIIPELQKDKMQQTEDNKDWVRWAARTEGDNVRRGTNKTTDHSIANIKWLSNKNKRAQREKLQQQMHTTMKEQYRQ
jgi:hypothetical protein